MADRVDKNWQTKGLGKYSDEAIFGTLNHYGVKVAPAEFEAVSREKYPLAIADGWMATWKGTGQFSRFPIAAADELWRRIQKERLSPGDFAIGVVSLMNALEAMRQGNPEAPVGEAFAKVKELRGKLPQDAAPFMREVIFHLGDHVKTLNHLAEDLAKEGHVDDAADFADIEEQIFPDRAGTAKAIVRAARGEKDAAIADLTAIASGNGDVHVRLNAVDGLIHLGAIEAARSNAMALFDRAEKESDFHFGFEVAQRVVHILDRTESRASKARVEFIQRVEKMSALHDQHHHH